MRYYSVPADFKKKTIDRYAELNNQYKNSKVLDTYGNITLGSYLGSGRLARQTPRVDIYDLEDYINYSKERNIDFNYTLNASHLHNKEFTEQGVSEIKKFLGKLYQIGVRSLTVSLPSLLELIRSTEYDFRIRSSVICRIDNPNRAAAYKKMGVEKIVLEESINRDFAALKNIREVFGEQVEIIVNQICDKNCMYRFFHYNMMAGDAFGTVNNTSINYFEHRCVLQQLKSIDNLLKLCWVRPEDIKYYTEIGIHYFKLQGRHTYLQGGDPVKTVVCYFEEHYDGNLMDLLTMFANLTSFKVYVDNKKLEGFIKPFVEKENFCKNMCNKCRYCESYARKCIDYKKAEETITMAREFYNQYDQYQNLLQQVNPGQDGVKVNDNASEDKKKFLLLNSKQHDSGDFDF